MTDSSKVTTASLLDMKRKGARIVALTAYDAPTAALLNEAGVDVVLVGDSVGMTRLGYDSTIPVTVEEMLHHTKAAKRGNSRALLVADLPYLSYQLDPAEAVRNAGRFIKEAGAEAVKLEGGREMGMKIKALIEARIPVMGHLGMTPQSVHLLGGYKVQGKSAESSEKMLTDAKILEGAGCFAIVLECVPSALAKAITAKVGIPTIGIGAGPDCDGQILVVDDLLGMTAGRAPKFVKRYADLRPVMADAVRRYSGEVRKGAYPGPEHQYS